MQPSVHPTDTQAVNLDSVEPVGQCGPSQRQPSVLSIWLESENCADEQKWSARRPRLRRAGDRIARRPEAMLTAESAEELGQSRALIVEAHAVEIAEQSRRLVTESVASEARSDQRRVVRPD